MEKLIHILILLAHTVGKLSNCNKIWRGEEYHKKGLVQLGKYLDQYELEEGYLLIFDFRKATNLIGQVDEICVNVENDGKKIIEVYC